VYGSNFVCIINIRYRVEPDKTRVLIDQRRTATVTLNIRRLFVAERARFGRFVIFINTDRKFGYCSDIKDFAS